MLKQNAPYRCFYFSREMGHFEKGTKNSKAKTGRDPAIPVVCNNRKFSRKNPQFSTHKSLIVNHNMCKFRFSGLSQQHQFSRFRISISSQRAVIHTC